MASEPENEPSSTPKLSLFSFPSQPPFETPGMLTPPLQTLASVPFQWEDAPGKPRACAVAEKPRAARCLELPPRLVAEAKVKDEPSPTTVLEGPQPQVGRALSYTLSFSRGSFRIPATGQGGGREAKEGYFGSWRRSTSKGNGGVGTSFDFSPLAADEGVTDKGGIGGGCGGGGGGVGGCGGKTQVKITRIRRRGSLLGLSHGRSQLWASIYESIKQVVPWRRRQEKLRKMSS